MCRSRSPVNCIVPPHMLRALAESKDRRLAETALRTMLTSTRVRAQREIVGGVRAAMPGTPTGQMYRMIHDAKNEFLSQFDLPGILVRSEPDSASADAAVNEAYDGLGATYDLFAEVYNRNSIDGRGMRLVATVHYGRDYNNAFWNGEQMVFGDGDNIIFTGFTGSLDIIGHELTHGVVDFTADLEYHLQPGALNESFSDVFGSLVRQYHNREDAATADWLIGAEVLAPGVKGVALRSMKDPGSAYDDPRLGKDPQPKHMDNFAVLPDDEWNDWGGVHINSGIPNHAFYLLATQLGGNAWDDAGLIWYSALLQLWPTAQFEDCANVTTQVAASIFGAGSTQEQAVRSAWDEVGVPIAAPLARKKKKGKPVAVDANGAALKKRLQRISAELHELSVGMT